MRSHTDSPGAQQWVPDRPTHAGLRRAAQQCRGCDLYEDATQAVMGDGPVPAPVMLIGEQPGDQEDRQGHPFVGPAGRLLDEALERADIEPGSVYRTNVVKHFRFTMPTPGTRRLHRSPAGWQVSACLPWLQTEIDLVRPEAVVVLGATAGKAVYGSRFTVAAARGRTLEWPDEPRVAYPPARVHVTVHPSAVLRSRDRDADLRAFVADLVRVREGLGHG
ncbi:UdgX family uracil-DNA binding protein [Luteipulveratus halotolerans]|uniref:Type-4 uracil-DNA glycosylase n=1 Tax=Luteipulveratus halotolerans TaxID=1631356 RepID=A0A0L6CLQ4_9MICO|nr:UdgX family uracil-DNA binding protein [Luteipulveratus halotolerans]KNX38687.1 hypothetical protein VV01_18530 [Luteipulveratus halotolerans]